MSDLNKIRFAGRQRVPLAARPALLTGDESTLHLVEKKTLTGEQTDFLIERVLRAFWERSGRDSSALARRHLLESHEGAQIYSACAEQMRRARAAGYKVRSHAEHVEAITGQVPRLPSKNGISVGHYRVDGEALDAELGTLIPHPPLRSYAELALDAVLAATIPDWRRHHAHDVRLRTLLPDVNQDSLDARFSVDTVLIRDGEVLGLIEVGRGALMSGDDYIARRAFKRDALEAAGFASYACDLPPGPDSIRTLQDAAEWVAERFGGGAVPTQAEIRALVIAAQAETVLLFDLAQLARHVQRWQHELGSTPLTLQRYTERRTALFESGDPIASSIPAQATLHRMLRKDGTTLAKLSGGGRRRGQSAHRHAGREAPPSYGALKARVRRLGIRTPAEYLSHDDPTLPRDVKKIYPEEFAPDGWPGFLSSGASNADVVGLVAASNIFGVAKIGWRRWKTVAHHLEPDAVRPARTQDANARTFYKPSRVARFLVERGLTAPADYERALEELQRLAKPSPVEAR